MELLKITGVNDTQHWINPTKILRVTLTPSALDGEIVLPPTLIVHLDSGFSIQVADSVDDIVDKINKEI